MKFAGKVNKKAYIEPCNPVMCKEFCSAKITWINFIFLDGFWGHNGWKWILDSGGIKCGTAIVLRDRLIQLSLL